MIKIKIEIYCFIILSILNIIDQSPSLEPFKKFLIPKYESKFLGECDFDMCNDDYCLNGGKCVKMAGGKFACICQSESGKFSWEKFEIKKFLYLK